MGVLCFGSYAKLLGEATGLKQNPLVDLLFRCCEPTGNYSLDSGDLSNWINSKLELRDFIKTPASTIGMASTAEAYFAVNILPKIKSKKSQAFLESLHGLIVSDAGILPDVKATLLEVASAERAALFLSRAFLHSVQQSNVVDGDPLDGATQLPLPKLLAFEKTLINKYFSDVFIKVDGCKVSNEFSIEFRRLAVANRAFDFIALNGFLRKNLGRYVFSRAKLEKMADDCEQELIGQQAMDFLKSKGNFSQLSDEVGNMILYVLLEEILDAPKVFYQIEVSAGGVLSSKGGLHLLRAKTADATHQIIFGKSKLVGDLTSAVNAAFEVIANSKDSDAESLPLLEPTIMSQFADKPTRDFLKSILVPSKSENPVEADKAFAVFLGYNLGIGADADFTRLADAKMKADIQTCLPLIQQKIQTLGFGNYPFYFYLIPFNNVDSDKVSIMTSVCGGGAG